MRKSKMGSMVVLCCGVLLANGAFAADQDPAGTPAPAAAAAVKETPKMSGMMDALFTKLAPKFGGDANIEYDGRDSNFGDGLTSRVRLTMDADIDPLFYIHTRLTAKQYVYGNEHGDHPSQAAGYENEAIKVGMEQLYIGSKLGPQFNDSEVRVGRMPLWLANGMLADINGINGAYLRTSVSGVNAFGFFGREGTQALPEIRDGKPSNLGAAELSKTLGPVELGATYLRVQDTFFGLNANYVTPFNMVLFGQYAKDTSASNNNQGYWGGARYGNAGKKGEWDASLAYLRVESNINPNGQYLVNDGNLVGAKGARLKAHYAISNWSTLTLVQDFTESTSGNKQKRTDIELEVRF